MSRGRRDGKEKKGMGKNREKDTEGINGVVPADMVSRCGLLRELGRLAGGHTFDGEPYVPMRAVAGMIKAAPAIGDTKRDRLDTPDGFLDLDTPWDGDAGDMTEAEAPRSLPMQDDGGVAMHGDDATGDVIMFPSQDAAMASPCVQDSRPGRTGSVKTVMADTQPNATTAADADGVEPLDGPVPDDRDIGSLLPAGPDDDEPMQEPGDVNEAWENAVPSPGIGNMPQDTESIGGQAAETTTDNMVRTAKPVEATKPMEAPEAPTWEGGTAIAGIAYVDGSYNDVTGTYGYGGFVEVEDSRFPISGAGNNEGLVPMRNVAGEILGATVAAETALELGVTQLTIYYDYMGIENWPTGKWQANKPGTVAYRDFMRGMMAMMDINFVHVKGHSGIRGNEEADRMARKAVGLCQERAK